MMTTAAALLGALPIAPGYGADGSSRRPLGLVVVSGLIGLDLSTDDPGRFPRCLECARCSLPGSVDQRHELAYGRAGTGAGARQRTHRSGPALSGSCWRLAIMTESELIQARRPIGRTRKWQVGGLRYGRKREGAEDRAPSPRRTTLLAPGSYLRSRIVKGIAVMKLEEYDFTRNPIDGIKSRREHRKAIKSRVTCLSRPGDASLEVLHSQQRSRHHRSTSVCNPSAKGPSQYNVLSW